MADSHHDELAAINAELRAFGIEYPLGARGVRDLRGFAQRSQQWQDELAAVAGLTGDRDEWATQLAERLARLDQRPSP